MKKNPKVRKFKTLVYGKKSKSIIRGKKSEIKIRGEIISISLKLEQKIEFAIYDAFMPRIYESKIRKLYIEEFIKPIQFAKKIRLFNELLKTKFYQKKIKLLIEEEKLNLFSQTEHFLSVQVFTAFINKNISEILKYRNTIAHGYIINDFESDWAKKKELRKEVTFQCFNNQKRKSLDMKTVKPILENVSFISEKILRLLFIGKGEDLFTEE